MPTSNSVAVNLSGAARGVLLFGLLAAAGGTHAQSEESIPDRWVLQTAGFSHHSTPPKKPGSEWSEQHPGFGLEIRRGGDAPWRWRHGAGVLQDSRRVWGGYAAASMMRGWSLLDGSIHAGAGLGAYAFYRSVNWSGRRAWVPAILPTMSIDIPAYGLGVNALFVPPIGRGGDHPAVLFTQVTYQLR